MPMPLGLIYRSINDKFFIIAQAVIVRARDVAQAVIDRAA